METYRRILAVAVAVLFAATFTGAAVAAEKWSSLKGEVVAVDLNAKTVTVKAVNTPKMGTSIVEGQLTFAVDHMTKISMGKKHEALGKIKAGDMVEVKYHAKDGRDIADSLLITSHYAAK